MKEAMRRRSLARFAVVAALALLAIPIARGQTPDRIQMPNWRVRGASA